MQPSMTDDPAPRHPSLRDRLDAAHAAADEVVAEESGQLGSEVGALALPFEELAAAVRAAIDPGSLADGEERPRAVDAGPGAAPQETDAGSTEADIPPS